MRDAEKSVPDGAAAREEVCRQLLTGFRHELMNRLTSLYAITYDAEIETPAGRRTIEKLHAELDDCQRLVESMGWFPCARPLRPPQPTSIGDLLRQVRPLLLLLGGVRDVPLEISQDADTPPVVCEWNSLILALLTLIIVAGHSAAKNRCGVAIHISADGPCVSVRFARQETGAGVPEISPSAWSWLRNDPRELIETARLAVAAVGGEVAVEDGGVGDGWRLELRLPSS